METRRDDPGVGVHPDWSGHSPRLLSAPHRFLRWVTTIGTTATDRTPKWRNRPGRHIRANHHRGAVRGGAWPLPKRSVIGEHCREGPSSSPTDLKPTR